MLFKIVAVKIVFTGNNEPKIVIPLYSSNIGWTSVDMLFEFKNQV